MLPCTQWNRVAWPKWNTSAKFSIERELGLTRLSERCRLDDKETITMMNNLKMKWADTNARYQRLSVALDLDSQKRQKERYNSKFWLIFQNSNQCANRSTESKQSPTILLQCYSNMSTMHKCTDPKTGECRFEENLTRLEKDVSLLSLKVILVSDTAPLKVQKEVSTPKNWLKLVKG